LEHRPRMRDSLQLELHPPDQKIHSAAGAPDGSPTAPDRSVNRMNLVLDEDLRVQLGKALSELGVSAVESDKALAAISSELEKDTHTLTAEHRRFAAPPPSALSLARGARPELTHVEVVLHIPGNVEDFKYDSGVLAARMAQLLHKPARDGFWYRGQKWLANLEADDVRVRVLPATGEASEGSIEMVFDVNAHDVPSARFVRAFLSAVFDGAASSAAALGLTIDAPAIVRQLTEPNPAHSLLIATDELDPTFWADSPLPTGSWSWDSAGASGYIASSSPPGLPGLSAEDAFVRHHPGWTLLLFLLIFTPCFLCIAFFGCAPSLRPPCSNDALAVKHTRCSFT